MPQLIGTIIYLNILIIYIFNCPLARPFYSEKFQNKLQKGKTMLRKSPHSSLEKVVKRFKRTTAFVFNFILVVGIAAPAAVASAQALSTPIPLTPEPYDVYTSVAEIGTVVAAPAALPEFSWRQVEGAKQYQLQVSRDVAFTINIEYKTPLTRYTPTRASEFSDGLWYWRVRVSDPSPGSYFSQPIPFTRQWASPSNQPVLISPASGATLQFFNGQDFSWQPVVGAAKYRFQIATSTDAFSHPTYETTTLYTTHQAPAKFANGGYFWRVIPIDPANREGTPSEIRPFQMGYNQVPTLLEPANNSFPVFTPTFRWTAEKGAQFYRLQYSTDPTFNAGVTTIDTKNTTYTPESTLPNDVNYYWRVRTHSGASVSDWSPTWSFLKHWYLQPTLLTPTNLYQLIRFPVFNWTPVPGAATYKVEWNSENSFPPTSLNCIGTTSNTSLVPDKWGIGCASSTGLYYWRVTPFDGNGKQGKPSQVISFVSAYSYTAPALIYPPFNYQPNPYFDLAQDVDVAYPIFQWNRVLTFLGGSVFSGAYQLQIDTSPQFDASPQIVDTENLMVAPDQSNGLSLSANTTYYWRVCPTASRGSACLARDSSTPWWSQTWAMKFDPGKQPSPTNGASPELLRPQDMREFGDLTPVLQWLPYKDADSYEIQISVDPGFANPDIVAGGIVPYPAYAPETSLAQRSLGKTGFGTFYWRVQARKSGDTLGDWSAVNRFMIAAHSQWQPSRTLGDPSNQLLIATSPAGGDPNFDLTTLYAAQDADNWFFGFNAYTTTTDMKYVLYLDQDHLDGSGADSDAQGISISTSPAYQPEYAIYISQISSAFNSSNATVYKFENNSWSVVGILSSILGGLTYDSTNHYLEIKVPNTAIGSEQETGSYALALFSVDNSGSPKDSVPASPGFPASSVLSRFTNLTERITLSTPFDNTPNDPAAVPMIPVVSWEYPADAISYGITMIAYLDPQFTTEVGKFVLVSDTANYAYNSYAWPKDFQGDNTYYWRVRPNYSPALYPPPKTMGAFSEGWRIERRGFIPANLQESISFATPTFSWDLTEGAEVYNLVLDTDPGFSSPDIDITTSQNSYTPRTTLANGHYYWRVRVRRNGNIYNQWSPTKEFDLDLPVPGGLTPNDPQGLQVLSTPPTFCWDPLIVTSSIGGDPVLTAYKYRIQVSRGDPTFSSIYDWKDVESNCWTPTKGYDEGKYYWRVAMFDGQGRQGDFSPAAIFTKQYPITTLVYPLSGPPLTKTPTFKWTVVTGAAAYRLEVSLSSTFYPIYDSVTTNAVEYTPTKIYESPKTYYWRIAIIDADGKLGPFTNETIIFDPNSYRLYLPLLH